MHQFTPVNYFKAEIEKWDKLGLQLLFLPPYSPELNKIEILLKHMKYHYHKLEAYLSFDNLHKHVKNLLDGFAINYDINLGRYLLILDPKKNSLNKDYLLKVGINTIIPNYALEIIN